MFNLCHFSLSFHENIMELSTGLDEIKIELLALKGWIFPLKMTRNIALERHLKVFVQSTIMFSASAHKLNVQASQIGVRIGPSHSPDMSPIDSYCYLNQKQLWR